MATLSEFGWERKFDREQLLSRLLSYAAGLQPFHDGYSRAMDYYLHQVQHHRFPDTDPGVVEANYEGLEEHFANHAQLAKARWLRDLRQQYMALQLGAASRQLEFEHRVLSVLYELARDPLRALYRPPLQRPMARSRLSPAKASTTADRLSVSDWDEEAELLSSSSLSSWSLSDTCSEDAEVDARPASAAEARQRAETRAQLITFEDAAVKLLERCQLELPAPLVEQEFAPTGPGQQVFDDYPSNCLFTDVIPDLYEGRGWALPDPSACIHEDKLVHQVISMLLGSESPGSAFEFHRFDHRFTLAEELHVPTLSPSLLDNLMQPLLNYGSMAVKLKNFLELIQLGVNKGVVHVSNLFTLTPTLMAFAACLKQQLNALQLRITALAASRRGDGTNQQQQPLLLIDVHMLLEKELRLLEVLYQVMNAVLPAGRLSPSEATSHLLTVLHGTVADMASGIGAYGAEHAAVLLQLFLCSLRPLLDTLHHWMQQGLLDDAVGHCFITADHSVDIYSSTFWSSGYTERYNTGGDSIAAPSFLLPLVEQVLTAGKSLLLLRHGDDQEKHTDIEPLEDLWSSCWKLLEPQLSDVVAQPGAQLLPRPWPHPAVPVDLLIKEPPGTELPMAERMAEASRPGGLHYPLQQTGSVTISSVQQQSSMSLTVAIPEGEAARHTALPTFAQPGLQLSCSGETVVHREGQHHDMQQQVLDEAHGHPAQQHTKGAVPPQLPAAEDLGDLGNRISCILQGLQQPLQSYSPAAGPFTLQACGASGTGAAVTPHPTGAGAVIGSRCKQDGRAWERLQHVLEGMHALRMPTGSLSEELWGTSAAADVTQQQQRVQDVQQARLMAISHVTLPPNPSFLRSCIQRPIVARIDMVGEALLKRLLGDWALLQELQVLRNTYLMSAPVLHPFTEKLFQRFSKGERLHLMSATDLETLLQQCLPTAADVGKEALLPSTSTLTVELSLQGPPVLEPKLKAYGGVCSVAELQALRFHYAVRWPLTLLLDEDVLAQYNQITIFLLQVLWAQHSLEQLRRMRWRNEGVPLAPEGVSPPPAVPKIDRLTVEMTHFVVTLHSFVSDRMLYAAWTQLQQALLSAKSLEQVRTAHQQYMHRLQSQCFLLRDKTWRLLDEAVQSILNLVLAYCKLQRVTMDPMQVKRKHAMKVVSEQLVNLDQEFRDKHRYLLKLLTARTLKISGESELQALVMRLNYNRYYSEGAGDDLL